MKYIKKVKNIFQKYDTLSCNLQIYKNSKKVVDKKRKKLYNESCLMKDISKNDIGLSPSGKALDFDSSIPMVRIHSAQPNFKILISEYFVFSS